MEQDKVEVKKKKFYKKWWFWVLIVLFVGLISNEAEKIKKENVVQNSTQQTSTEQTQTGVTEEKQYREIMTFSGSGAKKSEPFTIQGSRFKISYDCKGDPSMTLCQSFVLKVGSTLPQLVMNTPQSVKDETIIYGKGEYYIDANVIGSFTMTIYDYR